MVGGGTGNCLTDGLEEVEGSHSIDGNPSKEEGGGGKYGCRRPGVIKSTRNVNRGESTYIHKCYYLNH